MRFKIQLLTTVSTLVLIGAVASSVPAAAADLGVRSVAKAPVFVEPPFSWTGFYVGVHGGAGWLNAEQTTDSTIGDCDTFGNGGGSRCSFDRVGAAFGGFAGYNWQASNIVFGIEADGTWLDAKESQSYAGGEVYGGIDWLATVRGRLGIAFSPTMIYVTGGVAFGGVNSGWVVNGIPPFGVQIDKTKTGWVVGGGIEHAFNKMWSVRAEVLYHDLGKDSGVTDFANQVSYGTEFRHTVTTARAGLALRW